MLRPEALACGDGQRQRTRCLAETVSLFFLTPASTSPSQPNTRKLLKTQSLPHTP